MQRSLNGYLWDIASAGLHTMEVTSGETESTYEKNLSLRRIVERNFEIIGEAIHQANHRFPGGLDGLSHSRKIVAFRNRLAHGYHTIDDQQVWTIVQTDLPQLLREVAILRGESTVE